MMGRPLTPKQQRFVAEYLIDLNAAQAAIRAGYSARRSDAIGHENLRKPEVAAAIQAAMEKRSAEIELEAREVATRLNSEDVADLADLYDSEGRLKPISEWPPIWRSGLVVGVKSFEEYEGSGDKRRAVGVVREVKLADRVRHKELLLRHLGGFVDKTEVRFPDGPPQVHFYLPDNGRDNGRDKKL